MSNLIPEARVDKNGKLVTRHVKPKGAALSRSAIAPPTPAGPVSVEEWRASLAEALQFPLNDMTRDLTDHEKLEGLLALAQKHDVSVAAHELTEGMSRIDGEAFDTCLGLLDRNFDLADTTLGSGIKSLEYRSYAPSLVTALNLYRFKMKPEDEAVLVETMCRLWINEALDDNDYLNEVFPTRSIPARGKSKAIGNSTLRDDLSRYIVANPEKIDFVVAMVTERKISDPKVMQDMLDNGGTAALESGVL